MKFNIGRKNFLLRIFAYILGGVLLLLISVISLAAFYEKEVSAYFLSKLNERLNTRVEIQHVELSLLRQFPYATVRLNQVKASHAGMKAKGHLLDVERIDLMFGIFSLWSGEYAIRRIEIAGGKVQLLRDADGRINYDIIKPAKAGSDDSFGLSIDQIVGRKIDLVYLDELSAISSRTFVELAELSGKFSADAYNMDITADLDTEYFKSEESILLRDRPMGIDFSLAVNKPQKTYSFNEGTLRIADLDIAVEGQFRDLDIPAYKFSLLGKNLDIETALSLLPQKYQEQVKAYQSRGKFYGEAILTNGKKSGDDPAIRVRFGVEQGIVSHKSSGIELRDLNFQGEFNGQILKLERVNMLLNGQKISGSCVLEGLSNPRIRLQTDARINLGDLGAFLDLKTFENLKGTAVLKLDLNTRTGIRSSEKRNPEQYVAEGKLEIRDASFRLKDDTLHFQKINGTCTFNQSDLDISSVSVQTGKSDFTISGKLQNMLGWLLNDQGILGIHTQINSGNVDLNEFFQRKTENAAGNAYRMEISPRILVTLQASIDRLTFRKFRAEAIQGTFRVKDQRLTADNVKLNTMGGQMNLSGGIDASEKEHLDFSCQAKLRNVDIARLFYECENFGQETMQDKNLKGRVDAVLIFAARGQKSLELDAGSVECTADITINNGELIRFEPLNVLGKYISLDELQQVRFSQLRNQIKISKRTIYFPLMDIESSAISISGSGTHTFDNEINYQIRVRLSDILSKKAKRLKKENEEFGEVADDGSGGLNLFLSMKGPIENPKISYDTKGAREKRKDDIRKEKEILRNIFREEFGKEKKDTVNKTDKPFRRRQPAVILDFDE